MEPFKSAAPGLWAAGYAALPLRSGDKRPFFSGWTQYCEALPSEEVQAEWLDAYPDNNVGVALGRASGVMAVDLDSDDPAIRAIIEKVLPPSPWTRVGRKGAAWVYQWNPSIRSGNIVGEDGATIIDFLSSGKQIVVPPSIHPGTGKPYWESQPLAAIPRSAIHPLPQNIDALIREALISAGVKLRAGGGSGKSSLNTSSFVSRGGRDTAMTAFAGLQARGVLRGERSLFEALTEMETWVSGNVEQVEGDGLDPGKARKKVAEFLLRDVTGPRRVLLPSGWDEGLSLDDKEALGLHLLGDDARKLTLQEIIQFVTVEVSRPGIADDEAMLAEIAKSAAARVAANDTMTAIDEGTAVRFIKGATRVQVPEIKKHISDLRKGEIEGLSHQEIAMAAFKELCLLGDNPIRYDQSQFWQWGGSHWNPLEEHKITSYLGEHFSHYPAMRKYGDHIGALRAMRDSDQVQKPLRATPISGLNFANGFLTREGKLIDHDPDFGMVYTLPYNYDPGLASQVPHWTAFLERCWGKDDDYEEKVKCLQEAFGVTLFGEATGLQRVFLLKGDGGEGKSCILEVLVGIMPRESVSSVGPEDWGDKFMPAEMVGKLLNIGGEISEKRLISGDRFKLIVDGSEMQLQRKNQHPFMSRIKAAQWFSGNFLPKTHDTSHGFTRRFLIFDFLRKASESGVSIPHYGERLAEMEASAIAAWGVEGFMRYRAQGEKITEPASSKRRVIEMAEQNDSVMAFFSTLREEGILRVGKAAHDGLSRVSTSLHELYMVYKTRGAIQIGGRLEPMIPFRQKLEAMQRHMDFKLVHASDGVGGPTSWQCQWLTIRV